MIKYQLRKSTIALLATLGAIVALLIPHNGRAGELKVEATARYSSLTLANKKLPERFLMLRLANKTPFDRIKHDKMSTDSKTSIDINPGDLLRLSGTARSRTNVRARVENLATKEAHWVSEGEMVFGWQLQSIRNESVKLQRDGTTIQLSIYRGKNANKESQE